MTPLHPRLERDRPSAGFVGWWDGEAAAIASDSLQLEHGCRRPHAKSYRPTR